MAPEAAGPTGAGEPTGPEQDPCARCGAWAPAVCSGCRAVRYCGPECQRAAWKAGHRLECDEKARTVQQATPQRATPKRPSQEEPSFSLRCPTSILRHKLPRLDRLNCTQAQEMLCLGQAFVAPMEGLCGSRLRKWDFQYLSKHLPSGTQYGVMLDEGSGKIVMSHSARNGARQVDSHGIAAAEGDHLEGEGKAGCFNTSDQTRMTFAQFVESANAYKARSGKGKLPYFGLHLLWRFKPEENGFLGQIDDEMAEDLWSMNFPLIKEWQDMNVLPLVQRFYLFAGVGGTLYHCHYDLQPNLHVQLSGRKRFILFPPEDWRHLYPFPVHHDLDRRSMVDLDNPSDGMFPKWQGAQGHMVELNPGDALYIPPYWWHHVQSITPETTSMAMWFFEHYPQSADVKYGVGPRAAEVELMRDVEELIGKFFADAPGEDDCTKARPVKAAQVANYVQWLKPRLGFTPGRVDAQLLDALTTAPEEVEEQAIKLIQQSFPENALTEGRAREKLKDVLDRRF